MNTKLLVSIVCPFYNEESGVISFHTALIQELNKLTEYAFDVVCIDDGSEDNTLKLLKAISDQDDRFIVIELSRNFGKEAALSAGLEMSQGDLIILIGADLQDPISLIGQLIQAWEDTDADAVLARRSDRKSDTISKRFTAAAFYRLYNQLSHVSIPVDVGDCRLMTRPVVDAINALPEKQRFMKGLFNWIGFKTVTIEYFREKRVAGKSKFSGWKLWKFTIDWFGRIG
jgi:glycosyltransferase involved in cell wall biosynthesis